MTIPLVDLAAQFTEVADEVRAGMDEVLASTAFVGGPQVTAFEKAYARLCGVDHCVGVANGTDALEMALRSVGVSAGGEVVMPVNTFIATAEAVLRIGARPVFVDVTPHTLLMDPKGVDQAITSATQAVVPVHLYGQIAPVEEIRDVIAGRDIPIVEDAAQSQGATRHGKVSGSLGAIAATSFYPGKNLGAAGDAGAVTTDDPVLAERVRILGAHGSATKYVHQVAGFNSRLDTIQAVVLSAKLTRLHQWNVLRRQAAARYFQMLADVEGVTCPGVEEGNDHVWHLFVIRVPDRDRLIGGLQAQGIGAGIHYPTVLSLTEALVDLGHVSGDFPVAELAAGEILSLPMYPHITEAQQEVVVEALRAGVT